MPANDRVQVGRGSRCVKTSANSKHSSPRHQSSYGYMSGSRNLRYRSYQQVANKQGGRASAAAGHVHTFLLAQGVLRVGPPLPRRVKASSRYCFAWPGAEWRHRCRVCVFRGVPLRSLPELWWTITCKKGPLSQIPCAPCQAQAVCTMSDRVS
jgi:hypothetical protein